LPGATTQLGSHADDALAEIDVAPREPEDLLDPHAAEHSEREQGRIPLRATVEEPTNLVTPSGS